MIDSTTFFAIILVLTSFTTVVNGFKSVRSSVSGIALRQQSFARLSASLKPQITKLIARQDLTAAETEVCVSLFDSILHSCIYLAGFTMLVNPAKRDDQ